ncbi:MAG: signal peptidase I [Myxococcota bacterium]
MKRLMLILSALLCIGLAAVLIPIKTVAGDEMAWTLRAGDTVWIVPGTVFKGDVVLLNDPLDPDRTVLRRVVGMPGDKIRVEEGTFRINGKRVRQKDMNEGGSPPIWKEVIWSRPPARPTRWFVTYNEPKGTWSSDGPIPVPTGHVFVMADSRDVALDSRWWGPVPVDQIQGVVRARYGPADPQRETAFEFMRPIDQPSVAEKEQELIEDAAKKNG